FHAELVRILVGVDPRVSNAVAHAVERAFLFPGHGPEFLDFLFAAGCLDGPVDGRPRVSFLLGPDAVADRHDQRHRTHRSDHSPLRAPPHETKPPVAPSTRFDKRPPRPFSHANPTRFLARLAPKLASRSRYQPC